MLITGTLLRAVASYESWGGGYRNNIGDTIEVQGNGGGSYLLYNRNTGQSTNWNMESLKGYYELLPKRIVLGEPKTEIEWLDRVRDNFKE